MFDFAWSELALIALVALVVIGPKDLPRVLRTVGIWVRQARSIAREFQGSLEQMMREAELDEVKRDIQKAASIDVAREFENTIDPKGDLARAMNDPVLANPMTAPTQPAAVPEPAAEASPPPAPAEAASTEAASTEAASTEAAGDMAGQEAAAAPQPGPAPAEGAPERSPSHA